MTGRGGRDGARVAQPTQRENVTRQGGPGGASGAATSGRGGRNAARQQNVVPQQGVTQQNQQQGTTQQNRTSRTAPPPAQNIAPQQGGTQQNQQGASRQIGRAAQLRRLHKTSLRNKVSGISKM